MTSVQLGGWIASCICIGCFARVCVGRWEHCFCICRYVACFALNIDSV